MTQVVTQILQVVSLKCRNRDTEIKIDFQLKSHNERRASSVSEISGWHEMNSHFLIITLHQPFAVEEKI